MSVLLGSGEHYGWERPRPAELVCVLAGAETPDEFAWLHAEAAGRDPVDVVVRPRFGERRWREPAPGERINVEAWQLSDDEADRLRGQTAWAPPQPLPHLWLWVEESRY